MPPPPQEERWFILAGIANAVRDKKAKRTFPAGADVSVAYAEPPRASVLSVPYRISSPAYLCSHPYVAAADSSGLILLCATEPEGTNSWITYHLCDARTGEDTCLREHGRGVGFHGNNIGLMVRDDDGGNCAVVAELQPAGDGTGRALLLCYAVGQYRWAEKELAYSPPLHGRDWRGEGVVSHGGMLWWVDLSYGLLACDPCSDEPELRHVPLPSVFDPLPPVLLANAGAHRCVRASGGMLRFVQIHGGSDAPVVSTWALVESLASGEWEWNPERRRVALADVWSDESYLDIMLPGSIPSLALLHPQDPDRVFFFLGTCIFAVDLRQRKVVEFSSFAMPDSPNYLLMRSSRFVHAWQYDPSSSRSEPLQRCLRQEKESSLAAVIPITRKTAKIQKRFRYDSIREQQYLRAMKPPTRKVGHRRGHGQAT